MSVFAARAVEPERKPMDFKAFFGSVIFRQEEPWTAAEAFLGIITAAAAADGHLSPEESEQILNTIHRSKLFKNVNGDELRKINNTVADRIEKRKTRAVGEACAALPENLRLACFAHAVDIVLSDGTCVEAEAEFLDHLMEQLSIKQEDAEKIAHVLDMKNNC
jgi:uncharacterized tellurite resistance protein B-like protein